jgi:hypothetical protein
MSRDFHLFLIGATAGAALAVLAFIIGMWLSK